MVAFAPPGQGAGSTARGRRVYDVCIFGGDLGGAVAAALLARKGLRVLLSTMGPQALPRESEGWLLPAAFPVVPPLRQLSGATGALDELGLAQELARQTSPNTGAFQLLSEKLRLSLPPEHSRRRLELQRELSAAKAAEAEAALEELERLGAPWDDFITQVPPLPARGFFERRRLKQMAPLAPALPEGLIGEALAALAPFAANLIGDTAPEATARLAAAMLRAPLRLWGGAAQLAEILRKKAVEAGAEVIADVCTGLRLERKGAIFELGGSEMHTSSVVLAFSGAGVAALCAGGSRAERKLAEEAALPVAGRVVLAHFVVREAGLPLPLEEAALLLGNPAGPLLVSSLPARRARGEATTERLLTVARVADEGALPDPQALLDEVRAALLPVLPFFDRHVLHQAADVSPPQQHLILQAGVDGEPVGLRPEADAHDRVMFASQAVYPAFGLEGQILGARAAAEKALLLSGRKKVAAT